METMTAIIKETGKPMEIKEVPNAYETLKDAVGGWIEAVYLDKGVILWVNEEGKLIGLPHNFTVGQISIEGNVIFTGSTSGGENKSLTEDQIKYVKSLLAKKATDYQKYIDTYFKEKDLKTEVWTYQDGGLIANIDSKSVIATLRSIEDKSAQAEARKSLALIDFINADIFNYLKFIADQMFENMKNNNPYKEWLE